MPIPSQEPNPSSPGPRAGVPRGHISEGLLRWECHAKVPRCHPGAVRLEKGTSCSSVDHECMMSICFHYLPSLANSAFLWRNSLTCSPVVFCSLQCFLGWVGLGFWGGGLAGKSSFKQTVFIGPSGPNEHCCHKQFLWTFPQPCVQTSKASLYKVMRAHVMLVGKATPRPSPGWGSRVPFSKLVRNV